jgi:hypothetical protein
MNAFKIAYPFYCFNERCHQSVYNRGRRVVSPLPSGEATSTMKHYCPSCKHELLSALDIELENMAIGGGLSLTKDIAVSENAQKLIPTFSL